MARDIVLLSVKDRYLTELKNLHRMQVLFGFVYPAVYKQMELLTEVWSDASESDRQEIRSATYEYLANGRK